MIQLDLSSYELCAVIEALYDALLKRMKWTVQRNLRQTPEGWGTLEFETAQDIINQMSSALAKATMFLREQDNVHPEFEVLFTPPDEVWDLITEVTLAEGWAQAPIHDRHRDCVVCERLAEV